MEQYRFIKISVAMILGMTAAVFSLTDNGSAVVSPGVLFEALAINRDMPTKAKPKYNSTTDLAVSPDKKTLFVAQQTAKRIDMVDLATQTVTGSIRLPNEVTGIVVAPDNALLYATCSSELWPEGKVCVVDIAAKKVVKSISVGHGARAPVLTSDGVKLFVCNRFSNDLSVIDMLSHYEITRIKMVREPYCAAISPDDKTVLVGNLLPDDRSTDTSVISGRVSIVDVEKLEVEKEVRLPRGSTGLNGITVSPDGEYAFLVHIVGHFNRIGTTVEKGWLTLNCLSIIDMKTKAYLNSVSLDMASRGLANPWDIVVTKDQRYLCVVHAGCHTLSIINYSAFLDSVILYSQKKINLVGDEMDRRGWNMSLLTNIRRRVDLEVQSPRTLAVVDSTIYTTGFFDDTGAAMEKCVFSEGGIGKSSFIVGPQIGQTVERQGEAYFYDAGLCFQQWQSCHTCHQFTRVSGLNRILAGGAVVAPKNTKSLLHTWWTPPTTWTGRRGHAEKAIPAGVELELFKKAEKTFIVPLDTFIMALKPVPSPFLEKGKLSEAAERGRTLFFGDRAQCVACHSGPLFADCLTHKSAVQDPYDANSKWDTPSLVEIWRTGPYGHIGSLWSVREMIELPGHNEAAAKLSADEMDDLVAYVLSL